MTRNSLFRFTVCLVGSVGALKVPARAADSGASVAVVYNTKMPESKNVAEHYARSRQVPADQVFGFDLPVTEAMTRTEFLDRLQNPLLKKLEANKLFTFNLKRRLVGARIRYLALVYGVPTKILRDEKLTEPVPENLPAALRRNEASVDSQLTCLPIRGDEMQWAGPLRNPHYATTNASLLHPTNGILLVTRLDGPTPAIARSLVDKALEAETNGLWGRAYFDARGLTNGDYKLGDDWMRGGARLCKEMGYETILDESAEIFPASFPMSHIAFYAGWYASQAQGPFLRADMEFMPGAFAYHLHSFSAQSIRTTAGHWVGPLLHRGATATMGSVDEPYLSFTPDIMTFFVRFVYSGFSFGEAAWASQNSLSWQNLAVGDPLYRPFARTPQEQHLDLEKRGSKLIEWSHLKVVSLAQAKGEDIHDVLGYLEPLPLTKSSAILTEKLADLYWANKKLTDALDTYDRALKLNPSPQQKIRVLLRLAERRTLYGQDQAVFDLYEQFLKEFPDYPDLLAIHQKLLPLAQKLDRKDTVERCEREIKRLTPTPPKS